MNHSNPFGNLGTPNMSKQRASKIQYEGDPDLIPPRSSECSVLVNILRSVSQKINEMVCEFFSFFRKKERDRKVDFKFISGAAI